MGAAVDEAALAVARNVSGRLERRFGRRVTMKEVGEAVGCCRSRVSQVLGEAVRRLAAGGPQRGEATG